MKDKIICALKSNILSLKGSGNNLWKSTNEVWIEVDRDKVYKNITVIDECKTFWGKKYTKERVKNVFSHYDYYVKLDKKQFPITKEEYDDIFSYKKLKKEEKKENALNNLCSENF